MNYPTPDNGVPVREQCPLEAKCDGYWLAVYLDPPAPDDRQWRMACDHANCPFREGADG